MKKLFYVVIFAILFFWGCNPPERKCIEFHDGSFTFSEMIDGEMHTTIFTRKGDLEISEYRGHIDSASVRWINDCEYVLKNINPNNIGNAIIADIFTIIIKKNETAIKIKNSIFRLFS